MFYDNAKTRDENAKSSEETRHNKEVLQYFTAGIALATAVISFALVAKKAAEELT